MNSLFYKIYHKTLIGNIFRYLFNKGINQLPDKPFLKYRYRKFMGKSLHLSPPRTLNEKINWLKLYDRTPLHTKCADKFAVREFVKEKIGEEYLVPLYLNTINVLEIQPQNIKCLPCIIKTNHDSGGGIFVYNIDDIDWNDVRLKLQNRLQKNYYKNSREWQYKNIEPCIIVEKLLQDANNNIPLDYKCHCFNGRVRMIQVDIGRGTKNHFRNWYDINWMREPYKWSSPKENGLFTDPSEYDVEKPETFDEMISLSNNLSQDFDYVRVDWYDVDSKLYFGELTFHHDSGTKPILPETWDLKLGDELVLTKLKSNKNLTFCNHL